MSAPENPFVPSKDYNLPQGQFMEKLLGDKFLTYAKADAIQTRAKLVLLQKYYPEDETKQQLMQDVMQAKKPMPDMNDFVPAEVDLEAAQVDAEKLAEEELNIDGVARLDEVLCNVVNEETLLACQQAQLGFQVMAIQNNWQGYEDIKPSAVLESDSESMAMAKDTVNRLLRVMEEFKNASNAEYKFQLAGVSQLSRISGFMAIMDAQDVLEGQDATKAIINIQKYAATEGGVERQFGYKQAYGMFTGRMEEVMRPSPEDDKPKP